MRDAKDANSILDAKNLPDLASLHSILTMSESVKAKSKTQRKEVDEQCLHCKETVRKPISSAYLSRHLKDFHRDRYDDL